MMALKIVMENIIIMKHLNQNKMKEDKVSETIGYVGVFLMIIILVVLGTNHFIGDPMGIHK